MLRIERVANGVSEFRLIGRLNAENVAELQSLVQSESKNRLVILDLKDVTLVDRDAVRVLEQCEKAHIRLTNCPAYIREWIGQERNKRRRA
jgi:anti-anti-sigma regulatory factor